MFCTYVIDKYGKIFPNQLKYRVIDEFYLLMPKNTHYFFSPYSSISYTRISDQILSRLDSPEITALYFYQTPPTTVKKMLWQADKADFKTRISHLWIKKPYQESLELILTLFNNANLRSLRLSMFSIFNIRKIAEFLPMQSIETLYLENISYDSIQILLDCPAFSQIENITLISFVDYHAIELFASNINKLSLKKFSVERFNEEAMACLENSLAKFGIKTKSVRTELNVRTYQFNNLNQRRVLSATDLPNFHYSKTTSVLPSFSQLVSSVELNAHQQELQENGLLAKSPHQP